MATVGTGALLGAVACSSTSDAGNGNHGSPDGTAGDSGEDLGDAQHVTTGSVCNPCGVVAIPFDSGNEADAGTDGSVQQVGGGISVAPDSGASDAEADHMVYGLIVHPGDGGQD